MNLKDLKEPFSESEIEWRIAQAGKKSDGGVWATCLAYVSARAIQDRLDAVVGPENWQCGYVTLTGSDKLAPGILCRLEIKIGDKWVSKEDGADQTDTEPFKGGLSSAFKRAGSAWGIGRYLYNLESGFAQIVDKKTSGAKRAKLKDQTEYYWIPPKLPSWATLAKKDPNRESSPIEKNEQAALKILGSPPGISDPQRKRLFALANAHGWDDARIKKFMKARFDIESTKDLTPFGYDFLCNAIEQSPRIKGEENSKGRD